jgi:acetyl esterase/lipase
MISEKIKIWEDHYNGSVQGNAVLVTYIQDNSPEMDIHRKRPAVLVCPGGGYGFVSDREKEPIAMKFFGEGFAAFTLAYDVAPQVRHPQPLLDVSRAMWIIRENADKWNIDPDRIAVCGFSAGGHLVASLGVFWSDEYISRLSGMPEGINKPNAIVLCYPVITSGEFAHKGSFANLLGQDATAEEVDLMSLEKRVTEKTPPAFIWHTFEDGAVPVENALMFAGALRKKGIPFDLHIFHSGGHGLALCDAETAAFPDQVNPHAGAWVSLCCSWLRDMFTKKA